MNDDQTRMEISDALDTIVRNIDPRSLTPGSVTVSRNQEGAIKVRVTHYLFLPRQ